MLVFFYGTKQIAFCNYADIETFTEDKKKSLLLKRHSKGADFRRAVDEIIEVYEKLKKRSDEIYAGEQVSDTKYDNLEPAMCDSSRKSPDPSSIGDNDTSEEEDELKENNSIYSLDVSGTSSDDDSIHEEQMNNEPIGKISFLDLLRHRTSTTGTTSRKRRLRNKPQSSEKHALPDWEPAGLSSTDASDRTEYTLDASQDESAEENNIHNITAVMPLYNCVEELEDGTNIQRNVPRKRNEEEILISSCKTEASSSEYMDDAVKLNEKPELPKELMVYKKKRKQNRNRVIYAVEYAMTKEAGSQAANAGIVPEPSNLNNAISEKSLNSYGDLPFVKRARFRMGKTVGDDTQLRSPVTDKKSEVKIIGKNIDLLSETQRDGNRCPNGVSLAYKEEIASIENNCSLPSPKYISFGKAKYQFKGYDFDVEAALPPSKRLHRALEAMSVNTAETPEGCVETLKTMDSNGLNDSSKSSPKNSSEIKVDSAVMELKCMKSSGNIGFSNGVSNLLSKNTREHVPCSDAKASDSFTRSNMITDNKKCNGTQEEASSFVDRSVSDGSVSDFEKRSLQSCSSNFIEVDNTSLECSAERLCSFPTVVNKKGGMQSVQECPKLQMENYIKDEIMKPVVDRSDSNMMLDLKIKDSNTLPPNEAVIGVLATDNICIMNNTFDVNNSSDFHPDEDYQTCDMQEEKETVQWLNPSGRCYSPKLTPMKELIAAAKEKWLSRSTSLLDNHIQNNIVSPSAAQREGSSRYFSPPFMVSHRSSMEGSPLALQNCRSPQAGLQLKDINRSYSHAEVNAARRAFEAFLVTLSRTKESVGLATRLAIDCSKYGIAGEVIDIIVHNLEITPILHKRVDLFFLIDSITQCSQNKKGGTGDAYCSLVQEVLPRLLSSAAPRGNAASENRKQCLKVLRQWLKRKTLPESIIRHHIRELEMLNEMTFPGDSSQKPLRTGRAFNDPVREMERVLADENGSNTSIQLPTLLHTREIKDEEGWTSEDKDFETITPARPCEFTQEVEVKTTEKYRHVLEGIDGAHEMENAAPRKVVASSSCYLAAGDSTSITHNQNDAKQLSSCSSIPDGRLPSPPPLYLLPFSHTSSTLQSAVPHQQSTSNAVSEISNLHLLLIGNDSQVQQSDPVDQRPSVIPIGNLVVPSESMPHCGPGNAGPRPMLPPVTSVCSLNSYRNFPAFHPDFHPGNNFPPPIVHNSQCSRPYTLPPLPRTASNQFSYINAKTRRGHPWQSFHDRFSYMPDNQRRSGPNDKATRATIHHAVSDQSRFSPVVHPEKVEGSSPSLRQYGPLRQQPPIPCYEWLVPPRISNFSSSPSRPPVQNPTSREAGGSGYWRPK